MQRLLRRLDGQVREEVKAERLRRLMSVQQEIAIAKNRARTGQRERVLVDAAASEGGPARARSFRDAPEVDASVLIEGGESLRPGDFALVEIARTEGYDVRARLLESSADPIIV